MPKKSKRGSAKSSKSKTIDKALLDNFVALQKVLTNLSAKFDNLSDQIAKLLEVFEISAKALAEKDLEKLQNTSSKEVLEKMSKLLEQNKTIAKSLTLMHEANFSNDESPIQSKYKPLSGSQKFRQFSPR